MAFWQRIEPQWQSVGETLLKDVGDRNRRKEKQGVPLQNKDSGYVQATGSAGSGPEQVHRKPYPSLPFLH